MRFTLHRVSSVLFGLSAVAPLVVWYLLIYHVLPAAQTPGADASSSWTSLWTGTGEGAYFVGLALLPVLYGLLAAACWHAPWRRGRREGVLVWMGLATTLMGLVICWPAVFTSGAATYYALRARYR